MEARGVGLLLPALPAQQILGGGGSALGCPLVPYCLHHKNGVRKGGVYLARRVLGASTFSEASPSALYIRQDGFDQLADATFAVQGATGQVSLPVHSQVCAWPAW